MPMITAQLSSYTSSRFKAMAFGVIFLSFIILDISVEKKLIRPSISSNLMDCRQEPVLVQFNISLISKDKGVLYIFMSNALSM